MKRIVLFILLTYSLAAGSQVQYGGGVNTFTSTLNSSTATLTSGSVFTGTAEDVSQYSEVRVQVFSDVASATDGLSLQTSTNGTNWDVTDAYTIAASTGKVFGIGVAAKYFRIVYTNGGTNQATFRLQTIYHKVRTKPSSQRPADGISNENDMEENMAFPFNFDGTNWNRQFAGQQPAWQSTAVTLSNQNVKDSSVTGQSAQTATVNNILTATAGSAATDVSGYRSASVQIVSTATGGTFIFEGSNDNTNFQTVTAYSQLILTGTPIVAAITPTSSNLIYVLPLNFRYFRCRIATTITGGSIQAVSKFSQAPFTPAVTQVAQATAGNLNMSLGSTTISGGQTASSSTSSGNPVRIGARIAPATPDLTYVPADAVDIISTSDAQLLQKPYSPSEYDFNFIGTIGNTTTAVTFKAAAGASIRNYLTSLTLTTDALGAAATLVIRDAPITASSVAANVITSATHDLKIGDQIIFSSVGSFTGISTATPYWVLTVPSATTFTLSASPNGSTLTVGGTGSPVFNRILYRTKLQTAALAQTTITFPTPLRGAPNGTMDIQTESSTTSGTVYYSANGYISF